MWKFVKIKTETYEDSGRNVTESACLSKKIIFEDALGRQEFDLTKDADITLLIKFLCVYADDGDLKQTTEHLNDRLRPQDHLPLNFGRDKND